MGHFSVTSPVLSELFFIPISPCLRCSVLCLVDTVLSIKLFSYECYSTVLCTLSSMQGYQLKVRVEIHTFKNCHQVLR